MVALSLFSIVVLVCVGALLALVGANKKAQALQAVMNDLNITVDSMARNMREGTAYNCNSTVPPSVTTDDGNCPGGDLHVSFTPFWVASSDPQLNSKRWVYRFTPPSGSNGGYIERSKDGGLSYTRLTSRDVSLSSVTFFVVGTSISDSIQPRVTVVVKGTGGQVTDLRTSSTFHIEASAVQRELDL